MTNNALMAGLSVILKPAPELENPVNLGGWLPAQDPTPIWISLKRDRGVTKAMPVLAKPESYPVLLQNICQQLTTTTAVEWQGRPYAISGVELEPDDFYIIQLMLIPSHPLPPSLGRAIHALFFKWISTADETPGQLSEGLANRLHQTKHNLPVLLSTQWASPTKIYLRITLLDKRLLSPLLWGLSRDLGTEIEITNILCRLGKHVQIQSSSSFEKLKQIPGNDSIKLEFLSPTSFKQQKHIQTFPLPELVFHSLLRRWNTFAPEHLQFPTIEWQGLVSAFDLKTHALRLKGGPEIGAQGWVKYRFPDPEQARIATVLAHFACFAGVGRKTTMGMGQTRLKQSSYKLS